MRIIDSELITKAVETLCIKANTDLPLDIQHAFENAKIKETSPLCSDALDKIILNCQIARNDSVPICQDTGMVVVFAHVGQNVHINGENFEDAINKGVRRGYTNGYLRCSVVCDPLNRINTGDNTPAIIYTSIVPGDKINLVLVPKGFGSENMSALKMFTPFATQDDIVDFVVNTCDVAGSNPCPPIIIGVGIGGTSDKAMLLAKKALLRPVGISNSNNYYNNMEKIIVKKVNDLGIGAQGFGGTVTALCCFIEYFPTHIAGLPCAVNIGCHVTRHAECEI